MYRTRVDSCNRLWFVDTGALEYPNNRIQVQPPSIWLVRITRKKENTHTEKDKQNHNSFGFFH